MSGDAPAPTGPTAVDRLGVFVLALCGALAGLIEVLLVPLYAGATVLPVTVLLALVSNAALPWLARRLIPSLAATAAPFGGWLIVAIGVGAVSRPEGDVILPGSPPALSYVTYGMLLGGAVVGTATVVLLNPSPATLARKAAARKAAAAPGGKPANR